VRVEIDNSQGEAVQGELRVFVPNTTATDVLPDTWTMPVNLPKGAKQALTVCVVPERFSSDLAVELRRGNDKLAEASFVSCQELYERDRLLVVAGGSGSSFAYLQAATIAGRGQADARPWDVQGYWQRQGGNNNYYRGPTPALGAAPAGNVRVAYVDAKTLPDNPEAYGSVATLALMADVTENTLAVGAQQALPDWVATGGHLMIAGGGTETRFEAPFFARLMPVRGGAPVPGTEVAKTPDGQPVTTIAHGGGWVTALGFDPDNISPARDTQATIKFFGERFLSRRALPTLAHPLAQTTGNAIMVRNLKPPDLPLIVIFLLVYLLLVSPINYFVLKKLDRRELAWITVPAIVLVFTVGAYGIGVATKGSRLVLNALTIAETTAGQTTAPALTQLLIFSPSRTNYRISAGDGGRFLREIGARDSNAYDRFGRSTYGERTTKAVAYRWRDATCEIARVNVNMWDFRQFAASHTLDLDQGITASLTLPARNSRGAATGSITNGCAYNLPLCELYIDGAQQAPAFAMAPGQTVSVGVPSAAPPFPLSKDRQFILDTIERDAAAKVKEKLAGRGAVLLAYTDDARAQTSVRVNDRAPTASLTLLVVHLQERTPDSQEARGLAKETHEELAR
jgi:hypothetical protein